MSREARAAAMYEAGASTGEIAGEIGVSRRQVCRILLAEGAREKRPISPAKVSPRVAILAAEGMPATWIAHDTGIAHSSIIEYAREAVPDHDELVREWRRVWGEIRNNDALLALHYEIAPPTHREQKVSREAA